jgi:hypothetical protein
MLQGRVLRIAVTSTVIASTRPHADRGAKTGRSPNATVDDNLIRPLVYEPCSLLSGLSVADDRAFIAYQYLRY